MSFSQACRRTIIILFHALLITVPFLFTWVNEELFEFPKMLLVYGFTIAITTIWLTRMLAEKKWLITRTPLDWPLLAFLASQILSTLFSIHFRTSFFGYYTRFHGGLLSTISYTLLYYAFVSNITKKQLKALFVTLFLAAFGVGLYAIPEHFGHSFSCVLISNAFDVSCWVQDVQTRIFGTFGQPNWLAAYALMLIPLGFVLTSTTKKTSERVMYGGAVIALFLTVLFTRSRSGFGGSAIGVAVLGTSYAWLLFKKHGIAFKKWTEPASLMMAALAFGLLVLALGLGTPFTEPLSSYLNQPATSPVITDPTAPAISISPAASTSATPSPSVVNRLDAGGTDSGEIRHIVWQGALDVWLRYPLFGSGVETFAYSYYQDRPLTHNLVSEWDFLYNKAHNEFLNFLATTGIVGFTTYAVLLGWFCIGMLWELISAKNNNLSEHDRLITISLIAGVAGLTFSNYYGFSTVMVTVLLYLFFAIAMVLRGLPEQSSASKHSVGGGTWMLILVMWAIAIFLEIKVVDIWQADKDYATGKAYFEAGYAVEGLTMLQNATQRIPNEALFYDELAIDYARLALAYAEQKDATTAAQLANLGLAASNHALQLNDRHLNFYKTRVRVLIMLGQSDETWLAEAKTAIQKSIELAPTDAKLWYNLGIVEMSLGQNEQAITTFEKTVAMKTNYEVTRIELAKLYEQTGQRDKALEQYSYIVAHIAPHNQFVNDKIIELSTK